MWVSKWPLAGLLATALGCGPTHSRPDKNNLSPHPVVKLLTPAVRHLGRVKAGVAVDECFEFINITTRTIRFSPTVQTNCGCSAGWLSQSELAPGQAGAVRLTAQVPTAQVSQVLRATLNLEDPPGPPLQFSVTYDILVPWAVRPSELRFVGTPGSKKEMTVSVLKLSDTFLEVLAADTSAPNLTAYLKSQDPKRATIVATCQLPAKAGQHVAEVFVRTTDKQRPSIPIRVVMDVLPKFRVHPNPLLMTAATQDLMDAFCAIESDDPFRIIGVSCTDTDVRASPGTSFLQPAAHHVIRLTVAAKHLSVGSHRRKLTVAIDSGVEKTAVEIVALIVKRFAPSAPHEASDSVPGSEPASPAATTRPPPAVKG